MNEQDQGDAMRALFAGTETATAHPAFVAAVVERVKAERERSRLLVQVLTATGATVAGVYAFLHLGEISHTLTSSLAKSMPMLPAMNAGIAMLLMVIVACCAAYFVAERA